MGVIHRLPRALVAAVAAVVLVACAPGDGDETAARRPRPTTTTTTAPAPAVVEIPPAVEPAVVPVAAHAPARVSVLPGVVDRAPAAPKAPKPAPARKGPQSIGRIQIGRIGLDHEIFEGHTLDVLKYGPGHWSGTAMPGAASNTVFPGHRTTHTRPFWDIDKMQKGDHVVFITAAGRFTYQTTDTFIVNENETWIAHGTSNPTFTIFACHPKGSARQRYVVKGSLVKSEPYRQATASPPPQSPPPQSPPPESPPTTTTPPCIICIPG